MVKVVSYRQKLKELAKIYKIHKIFDQNLKLTTYDIEIILLKNNIGLPSNKRGYISHKIINEVFKPFYDSLRKFSFIHVPISKFFKGFFDKSIKKPIINFSINNFFKDLSKGLVKKISFITNKYTIFVLSGIEEYFKFIVSNIANFFKILTRTIIDGLNDIYEFKVKEQIIKNFLSKGVYASLFVAIVFSGFYIKDLIMDMDSVKISLEIKSDKKKNLQEIKKKETAKTQDNIKKNKSKSVAKLSKEKESLNANNDYNLNTQTVLTLFEDLEYDLDSVRKKKLVKPIYFTRLPKDLDTIKSIKEKKETFLQILLPLVVAENEKIKEDREHLLKIIKKNESEENRKWLNKKYKSYKVSDKNINVLIEKIDIIPTSIALAQAAKESGWGTSRFALEGNAIYGQWTWNGDGIEPLEKTKDQNHKILKFPLLRASVKAYINNLNTHRGYKSFRVKRAELRKQNKRLIGTELIHELDNYAQTGQKYTKILEKIINQNNLDELETVTIDDFKESNQLKL